LQLAKVFGKRVLDLMGGRFELYITQTEAWFNKIRCESARTSIAEFEVNFGKELGIEFKFGENRQLLMLERVCEDKKPIVLQLKAIENKVVKTKNEIEELEKTDTYWVSNVKFYNNNIERDLLVEAIIEEKSVKELFLRKCIVLIVSLVKLAIGSQLKIEVSEDLISAVLKKTGSEVGPSIALLQGVVKKVLDDLIIREPLAKPQDEIIKITMALANGYLQ